MLAAQDAARSHGGVATARCIILLNLTAKGLADLKGSPARVDAGIKAVEAGGGLAVCEAPSDEAATVLSMALGAQGYVTTQTLRVFSTGEFAGLVSKLP